MERGGRKRPATLGQNLGAGPFAAFAPGKVLENGMPRFFRRLAEGVFDEQDFIKRAHELADFIVEDGETYKLSKPVAVAFQRANIAAAILLLSRSFERSNSAARHGATRKTSAS